MMYTRNLPDGISFFCEERSKAGRRVDATTGRFVRSVRFILSIHVMETWNTYTAPLRVRAAPSQGAEAGIGDVPAGEG